MLSVIIPVYNEAKRLERTVTTVGSYLKKRSPSWEIVISEDGSTDDSHKIGLRLSKKDRRIRIVHSDKRLGKGGGIRQGIRAARGDILLFYDADMAVPAEEISKHLPLLKKYDFVIGSRVERGLIANRQPWHREFLGSGFSTFTSVLFALPFKDTQCGFKYFKKEVLDAILPELIIDGFAFDVEMISRAMKKGYKGTSVPVPWRHVEGSKVNVLKTVPEMLWDMLRLAVDIRLPRPGPARPRTGRRR